MKIRFSLMFLALLQLATATSQADDASVAIQWNEAVLEIAEAEDGFLTLKGLRTVTMMHIAMHDALGAISGQFDRYAFEDSAPDALPIVTASEAAFYIAVDQYPEHRATFSRLRAHWSGDRADTDVSNPSHRLGAAAAKAILAAREGDGWDSEAEYRWHPMAPGVYAEFQEHSATPEGFIFGAGWANARGFALQTPDQFRAPPPPDIDSDAYAEAFDEVKAVGRFQSLHRTPDQTHMALWWKDFAENSHNRLARDLIEKEALPLQSSVRLLALLNMAIFDAYVSSFENKFHYNHWRPYTAIRWAANDGNPKTTPEATWTNTHLHTYAFPSYPSAHGTACAAAMTAFETVFGQDYAFTMRTPTVDLAGPFSGKIDMQPPTRDFASFASAASQCGLSRVYLGIHFRYDAVEGLQLGAKVGRHVVDTLLVPKSASRPSSARNRD